MDLESAFVRAATTGTVQVLECIMMAWIVFPMASILAQSGQQREIPSTMDVLVSDVSIGVSDCLDFLRAPAAFGSRDWLVTAGIAGSTAALMTQDERIRPEFRWRWRSDLLFHVSAYASHLGRLMWVALFDAGLYAAGLFGNDSGIRVTARLVAQALVYGGLLTGAIQFLAGRDRPYAERGAASYRMFRIDNEYQSFPSGHTMVAFALCTTLADRMESIPASIALYTIATVSGLSLLYRDQHWASDVFLGAAIGYLAGRFVCERERSRETARTDGASGWRFGISPAGIGFTCIF